MTAMMLPTPEQLAYASDRLRVRREKTRRALITGDHVDTVARMVFEYGAGDATPDEIAHDILTYLAGLIEPLMADDRHTG